jgi:hypothetical protein
MRHKLLFTRTANEQYENLEKDHAQEGVLKQVRKTLALFETNLRAASLQTHEYSSLTRRYGIKVFEAYVQQNTPSAYRIFWHYGPDQIAKNGKRIAVITIAAITPHP